MDKAKPLGLIDSLKMKLIEVGVDYVKKNIENSKKEVVKYIEKKIENKIRYEIKKASFKFFAAILLIIALVFVGYGIFSIISYLLNLPSFITNIAFGIFLLLIATILWFFY